MRIAWLVIVMALGCGKSDDWTKKPIKTVSGKAGDVAYSIDLPDGMRAKPDKDSTEYDFLVDDYVKTPNFRIGTGGFAKTLDEYVKFEAKVTNWLRKEALPDGYIVSYENETYKGKEDYLVYLYRTFGDKTLTCWGRLTPWERGGTAKDKVPLVEKACLSLKPM